MSLTIQANRIAILSAALTFAAALCATAAPPPKSQPPKAPPPPPKTGVFSLPKHKSRPPRVITLKPGQTEPTPEDIKKARPLQPGPARKKPLAKHAPTGKKSLKKHTRAQKPGGK